MTNKEEIQYEDFEKLDLRVATIKNAEEIEGADKLYKLTLELEDEERTICAGIKEHYSKEELIGKQIVVVYNLAPRKLKGVTSHGMLLAADSKGKPILLTPMEKANNGSKIG